MKHIPIIPRKETTMAISIGILRGMSAEVAAELKEQGIYDSDQLLAAARTPAGRKALAEQAGVESQVILELANRADLARVRGIAGVFSDLLEQAGVDTVKELATRNPDNLFARLVEINAEKKLAGRTPHQDLVKDWIAQAKELPKLLEY
jgi:predicted flap endonuclease-1-like 5' DNA nuclease